MYDVISPEGRHERIVLGQDNKNGEAHTLLVKAGYYKATTLINGDYGLLGEAVTPGFEYHDNTVFTDDEMAGKFPSVK